MDLLNFYIPEWFFVALNLLILYLVLKVILWKPINRVLDAREELAAKTARDAEEAERLKAEAELLRERSETDSQARTVELMKDARARAGHEYERIVADAEKKAELLLSASKVRAEREYEVLMAEAKKQVVAVAVDMSGLLLGYDMDSERNKTLLNRYLAEKDVFE